MSKQQSEMIRSRLQLSCSGLMISVPCTVFFLHIAMFLLFTIRTTSVSRHATNYPGSLQRIRHAIFTPTPELRRAHRSARQVQETRWLLNNAELCERAGHQRRGTLTFSRLLSASRSQPCLSGWLTRHGWVLEHEISLTYCVTVTHNL